MARVVQRFLALSGARKRLLLEAAPALTVARLLMLLPFRTVSRWFRIDRGEVVSHADGASSERAREIGWAINAASRRMPFRCECMAQALAGKMMMGLRGLDAVVVIGVTKDEAQAFKAHAWLRHGDVVLTGDDGLDQFNAFKGEA